MRGEEMGLWIVLIEVFCVCVPALTGLVTNKTTVLDHTVVLLQAWASGPCRPLENTVNSLVHSICITFDHFLL